MAARSRYAEIVKILLDSGAEIDKEDYLNMTPLSYAASWGGQYDVAKMLINRGADINKKDCFRTTPLHIAATALTAGYHNVVQLLLERGVKPNERNGNGETPLHYAANNNRYEMVKYLLSWGADTYVKDNLGHTALQMAIIHIWIRSQQGGSLW